MFSEIPVLMNGIEAGTATIDDEGAINIVVPPTEYGLIVLDGFQRSGYTGFYINPRPAPPTQQGRGVNDEQSDPELETEIV